MFESLSERIHQDEAREESPRNRAARYAIIVLVSVGVVVALVEALRLIP
jgi:hypothetical protein